MAHQNLSDTGIVTGQIVQASEITQFVNAFTGVPVNSQGYDITISGSLNLTGSLLMTGSFINEFSGQFSSLGLGVVAPTAPTMLHIKDTAAGGDPIVLLEGNAGTDNARIRFSNSDVSYDLGAYGSSSPGDNFQIVQDAAGSALTPFIIGKNTPTETFQIYNGILGIGMSNFSSNTSNLPAKSIQAENTISSSLIQGSIISASYNSSFPNTVTIHGTASDAAYATTAGVVNSINLGGVVMTGANTSAFSASGNFNSTFDIVSNSGIIKGTYLRWINSIQDPNGESIIQGSVLNNNLEFGDPGQGGGGNGAKWKLDTTNDKSFFTCDQNTQEHFVWVSGDVLSRTKLIASGSSSPVVVVGPNSAPGAQNAPSSSLFRNSLEFNQNSTAYVSNLNSTSTSQLAFSAQGGSANTSLTISGSKDATLETSLIIKNRSSAVTDDSLRMTNKFGDEQSHARMLFEGKGATTAGATTVAIWNWQPNVSGPGTYVFKYSIIGANTTNGVTQQTKQCYFSAEQVTFWDGTQFYIIGTQIISSLKGGFTTTIVSYTLGSGNNTVQVDVTGQAGNTIDWRPFVDVELIGTPTI